MATTHHGVNFAKTALQDGGRSAVMKYVDALCSYEDEWVLPVPSSILKLDETEVIGELPVSWRSLHPPLAGVT